MLLTETQRLILSAAAAHPAGLALPPATLPPAPRAAVAKAMLKAGPLASTQASDEAAPGSSWKLDGEVMRLAITAAGRLALSATMGDTPTAGQGESLAAATTAAAMDGGAAPQAARGASLTPHGACSPPAMTEADIAHELDLQQAALDAENATAAALPSNGGRQRLRDAAQALLNAWAAETPLDAPLLALRAAMAKPARPARSTEPRQPRQGTKQQAVLALLRQPEGATIAQIAEATGWQAHTVRGFFAGLKQRGLALQVLERVRQVGPNRQGAKGSYSIYRLTEAG